jgi:phosphate transport system permease protein
VPDEFRNGARAMGATEWQVVKDHVLPAALPGIMTGSILGLSRAIGETAPILFVVSSFIRGVPTALTDGFLALPYQIFYWAQLPSQEVQQMAASAIIVLMALLLMMNGVAVAIRQWSLSRRQW